jgi:hypothetical protein
VGVREPELGLGDPRRLVDIAVDDEIGQAVPVEVARGRARVPAEDADAAVLAGFRELAALVPEQRAAIRTRHVKVCAAIDVEVGRHAALAPERDGGARLLRDVAEPALAVPEEPRRR